MMKLIVNVLFLVISFAAITKANPIANGIKVTSVLKYPFMASLMVKGGGSKCGGSIISKYNILTAAHCLNLFEDCSQAEVTVGNINWMNVPEGRTYNVLAWVTHKGYVKEPKHYDPDYDIALIRVDRKIDFSTNEVKPIPLDLTNSLQFADKVTLIGFGKIGNQCSMMTPFLHELESLKFDRKGLFNKQSPDDLDLEKEICTIAVRKVYCKNPDLRFMACKGDSGGPVIAMDPLTKKWKQVAVITTVIRKFTYSTKVFALLDWINDAKKILAFKANTGYYYYYKRLFTPWGRTLSDA